MGERESNPFLPFPSLSSLPPTRYLDPFYRCAQVLTPPQVGATSTGDEREGPELPSVRQVYGRNGQERKRKKRKKEG